MTRLLCRLALVAAVNGALGCAVGPDFSPPTEPAVPASFSVQEEELSAAAPEADWWAGLGDEQLDRLIARAIVANHDLRVAEANVRLARSQLGEGRLDRFPTVTAAGSILRDHPSAALSAPGFSETVTIHDVGFDASWELDFFGHVRRSVAALSADHEAALADQRAAFVIVMAEVARNYIDLRGAQYRLNVAMENARNQQQTFRLTQALLEGGRGTNLDIARAQSQLESTLAGIPPLEAAVAHLIHRLSVLVGQTPDSLTGELETAVPLPTLPMTVSIGDPASLLRRRPDIAAAEARLAAATARIGVATADLFPRITLLGSAGYTAVDGTDLGSSASERYQVGPFLSWPAFDLGRAHARIEASEAVTDGRLAEYERTVLQALEETENAMVDFSRARERQERLSIAAGAGKDAADLARLRYRNGADSFLSVLDAERRQLELQDQLATSETDTARSLIALYKALGGAWQTQAD